MTCATECFYAAIVFDGVTYVNPVPFKDRDALSLALWYNSRHAPRIGYIIRCRPKAQPLLLHSIEPTDLGAFAETIHAMECDAQLRREQRIRRVRFRKAVRYVR